MYNLGFDVGGTEIKLGIVDNNLKVVKKKSFPFPHNKDALVVIDIMANEARKLLAECGEVISRKLDSIGIATAGSIDEDTGLIINAYNLGFLNVPIVKMMKEYFPSVPIGILNDADAAALAELVGGALSGKKTAVLLTLGTGIGGGIIIDGKVFKGGLGHGNEIGHMTIMHGGPLCSCGNRGCIETLCTATWLIKEGQNAIKRNPGGLMFKKSEGDLSKVTAKIVIDSAKENDVDAEKIFRKYVDYLSSAIASIAVFLDPEVIALGGGVSLAGDYLFEPLKELVKEKSFFKVYHMIMPAKFGNSAGIIGAAMLNSRRDLIHIV